MREARENCESGSETGNAGFREVGSGGKCGITGVFDGISWEIGDGTRGGRAALGGDKGREGKVGGCAAGVSSLTGSGELWDWWDAWDSRESVRSVEWTGTELGPDFFEGWLSSAKTWARAEW